MSVFRQRHIFAALSLFIFLGFVVDASAAGMFLAPAAVRPLARGGAFVAGADDASALTYNPAGLSYAPNSALAEFGLPIHLSRYRRSVFGDDQRYEELAMVAGDGFGLPIPNFGYVDDLGEANWKFGVGFSSAYPAIQNWPDETKDGAPAPQRYAIGNFQGSGFGHLRFGAAYNIADVISVGASLNLLAGRFVAEMTASGCDGVVCAFPEDPDYDARMRMTIPAFVIPGVQVGVTVRPLPWASVAIAWESGYQFKHNAEIDMKMPAAPTFAPSKLSPERPLARVEMNLPMTLRSGVEVRYGELARFEAAMVWEQWSVHEEMNVDPSGAFLTDVPLLGTYRMTPMAIPRNLRDTISWRAGCEVAPAWSGLPGNPTERPVTFSLGAGIEPSATPDATLTPMTVDLERMFVSAGVSVSFGKWKATAMYSRLFMQNRTVKNSEVLQLNPGRPDFAGRTAVGNGTYSSTAQIIGIGAQVEL